MKPPKETIMLICKSVILLILSEIWNTLEYHQRALNLPGLAVPHSGLGPPLEVPGRAQPRLDLTKVDRVTIGARRGRETGTELATK